MSKRLSGILIVFFTFFILACQQEENVNIDVNELTIAEIHQSFTEGKYTSEQLVQTYLDRIKKLDSSINAITYINPNALAEAKALDIEFMETGKLRPLHGIPMIVKDNYNTKGMPTTAGALALKDFIPDENAFMVQKLIDAGAIIIAKSNMAEWAFSAEHTKSSTAGITRNPYNLDFVPAGSSGGTAASIAANLGVIGLGSDTGNSIRGPSSHCSLVGFRSTLGLVSREGVVPLALRNDVVGPMCRTVEDATRVLEVIVGYDPKDPITKHSEGKIPANYTKFLQKDGLKGARIGVLRELSEADPDPEVKALFENAIDDLQSLGAEIIDPLEIPGFDTLRQNQWCSMFREDIEAYLAQYVQRDTMKTLEDIIRVGTKSAYAKEGLEYSRTHSGREDVPGVPCGDAYTDIRRVAFRKAIEDRMDELNLDAIIYPSWNNKPGHIDNYHEEYLGDNSQIICPHTGQPGFTVPIGFTSGNLPAGLQFLGRMYDEPTLIKLCYAYEQGTKHRVQPPGFE